MESRKKHLHAIHIINHCSSEIEKYLDLPIRCNDGEYPVSSLLVAALSPTIKRFLQEIDASNCQNPLIVAPHLQMTDLEVFFRYLFSSNVEEVFDKTHTASIASVIQNLNIKSFDPGQLEVKDDVEPNEIEDEDNHEDEAVAEEPKVFVRNKVGSGGLECEYCFKKYHHVKAKNKHMISEHFEECRKNGGIFQCFECGANFVSSIGRAKHMIRLHPTKPGEKVAVKKAMDEFPIKCPFDEQLEVFKSVKDLKNHIKECHPDKDKSCIACGLECGSKANIADHIQVHATGTKEAANLLNCEHCHMKFTSEYNLVGHKREQHSSYQTLECDICDRKFKNAKFLKNHMDRHRNGEFTAEDGEFQCVITTGKGLCGKTFSQKANLERHIRSHQRIKTHECDQCGKTFVDSTRLKEHKWIHTDHRPHKCRFCDKSFRHKNHVRNHEANAHGVSKEFACNQCPRKFVYNYQLKSHMQSVHKEDADENEVFMETSEEIETNDSEFVQTLYQCSLCKAVFESYRELKIHCELHNEEVTQSVNLNNDQILLEVSGTGDKSSEYYVVLEEEKSNR